MRRLIIVVVGLALLVMGVTLGQVVAPDLGSPKVGDVITGQDLGFRVTGIHDAPTSHRSSSEGPQIEGVFVIRVKGQWTQAEEYHAPKVIPAN